MGGDPWVIQAHEHVKFAEHFRNLNPVNGLITGEQAKRFMLQSQLPPPVLGQIWFLADTNADGKLDLKEFSIACKIINLKLHGVEVPKTLPPSLLSSLTPTGGGIAAFSAPMVQPLMPNQALLANVASMPSSTTSAPPLIPPQPKMQPVQPLIAPLGHKEPEVAKVAPLIQTMVQPQIMPVQSLLGSPLGQPSSGPPLVNTAPLNLTQAMVAPMQPTNAPMQPLIGAPGKVISPPVQPLIGGLGKVTSPPVQPQGPLAPLVPSGTTLASSLPAQDTSILSTAAQPVTSTPIMASQKVEPEAIKSGAMSPRSETGSVVVSPVAAEWAIPQPQKLKYRQLFNATDRGKTGSVSGAQARAIMLQSRLPQQTLANIWTLADIDCDGNLRSDEFVLAMYLCELATQGEPVPAKLPPELIPPSFRRESVGSIAGSNSSYEERRRENMVRGQAELERRRTALADAQTKEKAERERKEREEAEKREKLRLEQQKREQEELRRKQKEEQEKREAARKEMERQCQLEWEKKRTRELEAMRTEEQAKVLSLKAKSQMLSGELSSVTQKASNLAVEIRETRTHVAQLKATIDGMRNERDACMNDMTQLKSRVKELNAKQIALNQEKAQLDAKAKASEGAGEDGKLSMMEVTLKQLHDKVEACKAQVEEKRQTVEASEKELEEGEERVNQMIESCEELWLQYEAAREKPLSPPAAVTAASAWDTQGADAAWGAEEAWGDSAAEDLAWPQTQPEEPSQAASAASVGAGGAAGAAGVAGAMYRCVYEFCGRSADELSLRAGELLEDAPPPPHLNAEPGWRWGRARGEEGWYPESYVEPAAGAELGALAAADPLEVRTQLEGIAEVPETTSEVGNGGPEPPALTTDGGSEVYVALYPYSSGEEGDLVFDAGERIVVVGRQGDWWTGTIGNRSGIFPSNYVSKVESGPAVVEAPAATPAETEAPAAATPAETGARAAATASAAPAAAAPAADEPAAPEPKAAEPTPPPDEPKPVSPIPQAGEAGGTPVSSEVREITEAAGQGGGRPASRRDSGRDSVTGLPRRKPEVAQAIAAYQANSPEQLSLSKGQLVVVRKRSDSGWWEGEVQAKGRGKQLGWFPATYVKILQASGRSSGRTTPVLSSKVDPVHAETVIDKVVALYPYAAQNADELSFDKDDIIAVTSRDHDPAWWHGEVRGMSGLFPSNYVTKLVHDN